MRAMSLMFGVGVLSWSWASSAMFLAFTPDPQAETGAVSPEGCYLELGTAQGTLSASSAGTSCHTGDWGWGSYATVANNTPAVHAEFRSEPIGAPLRISGPATIAVSYIADEPVGMEYTLYEIAAGGDYQRIVSGGADLPGHATGPVRQEAQFEVPEWTLAAGSRLLVVTTGYVDAAGQSVVPAAGARLFWGDATVMGAAASYADSGLTLTTDGDDADAPEPPPSSAASGGAGGGSGGGDGGGPLSASALAVLCAALWWRRVLNSPG